MNPYLNQNIISKKSNFLKTINWNTFLDNTQKTLNVINQVVPIIYQIKPLVSNVKTLFKVADLVNTVSSDSLNQEKLNNSSDYQDNLNNSLSTESINSPIFYL